jgi:hypothetical protein
MPQVLVQFSPATLKAIDRIAPAAKMRRVEFIRKAVKDAIFCCEQEKMRRAYQLQPDSAVDFDPWVSKPKTGPASGPRIDRSGRNKL